jgi:hypothetical protein
MIASAKRWSVDEVRGVYQMLLRSYHRDQDGAAPGLGSPTKPIGSFCFALLVAHLLKQLRSF